MSLLTEILGVSEGAAYTPSRMFGNLSQLGTYLTGTATQSGTVVPDNTFQTILTFTGKGQLQAFSLFNNGGLAKTFDVKITLDGTAFDVSSSMNGTTAHFLSLVGIWGRRDSASALVQLKGIETIPFDTSVLIQVKALASALSYVAAYKYVETE